MTWLFVALWKLPASSSLTRTAAARECVYGSVGGTKRPRSEFSPESDVASSDSVPRTGYLPPRPAVAKAPQRDAFGIAVRMPIRGQYPSPQGGGSRLARFHAPANARWASAAGRVRGHGRSLSCRIN